MMRLLAAHPSITELHFERVRMSFALAGGRGRARQGGAGAGAGQRLGLRKGTKMWAGMGQGTGLYVGGRGGDVAVARHKPADGRMGTGWGYRVRAGVGEGC